VKKSVVKNSVVKKSVGAGLQTRPRDGLTSLRQASAVRRSFSEGGRPFPTIVSQSHRIQRPMNPLVTAGAWRPTSALATAPAEAGSISASGRI
jgi:hypothetical protein